MNLFSSGKFRGSPYDHVQLLKQLFESLGIKRVFVVYHSGGGMIGIRMLKQAPELVAGSISLASFGRRINCGAIGYAGSVLKSANLRNNGEASLTDPENRKLIYQKFLAESSKMNFGGVPFAPISISSYFGWVRLSGLNQHGVSFPKNCFSILST